VYSLSLYSCNFVMFLLKYVFIRYFIFTIYLLRIFGFNNNNSSCEVPGLVFVVAGFSFRITYFPPS
jgi:hypothetical protein